MSRNFSDMRLYDDLTDLNRGFLGLMTSPHANQAVPAFGLDAAIINQLRRLSPEELEFIAATPGLLACFFRLPTPSLYQVAETRVTSLTPQPAWRDSARIYVTGLLTYFWQMEQQGWPCCALCAQSVEPGRGSLADLDFTRIHSSADFAVDQLRARFADYPSFWADLIRGARSGNEELQALAHLTIIPLVLAEECSARP